MENPNDVRLFTAPNLLSLLRLVLIPVILRLCRIGASRFAAAALLVSALTDVADGFIARRWSQVSDLGKALDPLADKLTQTASALCLARQFPLFLPLALGLCAKETLVALSALGAVRRTGLVRSARWHGKLASALMVVTLAAHLCMPRLSGAVSLALVLGSAGMSAFSGALYIRENVCLILRGRNGAI